MKNLNEFKINDFYQSCILKVSNFTLLRLERGNGRFVVFVFDDPESRATEIIEKYWNREVQVEARDLIETINEMKSRLYT